jgi:hypothetical protein
MTMPTAASFYDPKKHEEDDPCLLCELHRQAHASITPGALYTYNENDIIVIGETNGKDLDQHFRKAFRWDCPTCGHTSIVQLTPILWNANHDVYLTGGREFLVDYNHGLHEKMKEKLLPLITNYHERLLQRERLEPWNLLSWMEYAMEGIIANILYEHGLQSRDRSREGEQENLPLGLIRQLASCVEKGDNSAISPLFDLLLELHEAGKM